MKQRTTIQIERETLKRLLKKKKYQRETYDELLNRLLKKDLKKLKKESKILDEIKKKTM